MFPLKEQCIIFDLRRGKTMSYDPHHDWQRKFLATTLQVALHDAGFTKLPPRHSGEEEVWSRGVESTPFFIQVYTSIQGAEVRESGADAIRVIGLYENSKGKHGLISNTRVNRTGEIEAIKDRMIQRARETWSRCRQGQACGRCGAPMLLSKNNKLYCAEVCWKN